MKSKSYLKESGSGCSITIDASPGATKTEVAGVNQWRGALQVKIAAEPRDSAANEELLRFLSEKLSVARSSIKLIRGEKSSLKVITVPLTAEKINKLLRGE
jgi:uncharacterized protein (TIGR00251 family)